MDSSEHAPLEPPFGALAQDAPQLTDIQPRELVNSMPIGVAKPGEAVRPGALLAHPPRGDQLHPAHEAPRAELDHSGSRVIEPLKVVDRDYHRVLVGEPLDDRQHGRRDRTPVDVSDARAGAKEGGAERVALRWRESLADVLVDLAEKVCEPRVGKARLRGAGRGRQDVRAVPACRLYTRPEEGRLPDPRLALEDERGGSLFEFTGEPLDRLELGGSSYDDGRHADKDARSKVSKAGLVQA